MSPVGDIPLNFLRDGAQFFGIIAVVCYMQL